MRARAGAVLRQRGAQLFLKQLRYMVGSLGANTHGAGVAAPKQLHFGIQRGTRPIAWDDLHCVQRAAITFGSEVLTGPAIDKIERKTPNPAPGCFLQIAEGGQALLELRRSAGAAACAPGLY